MEKQVKVQISNKPVRRGFCPSVDKSVYMKNYIQNVYVEDYFHFTLWFNAT